MSADLSFLPKMLFLMRKNFNEVISFCKVSQLEFENKIFVEDGNHGEYRPLQDEFVENGVPFIRPPNLVNGRIDFRTCQKINATAFSRVRKGIGKGGDVILTHNATIGRVAFTNIDDPVFVANPQTTVWRTLDDESIDRNYLYYFMKSSGFQDQLEAFKGRNATFDYVSLTKQRELIIPLPSINYQRAIGNTLRKFDVKIHLNTQTNQTLESIAQAIFKSWFVDFEPVKAKISAKERWYAMQPTSESASPVCYADEAALPDLETYTNLAAMCAISGKSETELAQLKQQNPDQYQQLTETAALFPSAMVDSELGEIPAGWKSKTLGAILEPKKGKSITKKTAIEGNVPVVAGGLEPAYFHNQFNVTAPAITISASGANAGFVRMYHENIWASDCSYINNSQTPFVYSIYTLLKLRQDEIFSMQQGAAQPHIYPSDLMRLNLINPPDEIWLLCEKSISDMHADIAANDQINRSLTLIRDSLLPKLLSGDIDLTKVENEVT